MVDSYFHSFNQILIDLLHSKIREFSLKDQKYCFEILATNPGKKGLKKYTFACQKDFQRDQWLDIIRLCANPKLAETVIIPDINRNDSFNEKNEKSIEKSIEKSSIEKNSEMINISNPMRASMTASASTSNSISNSSRPSSVSVSSNDHRSTDVSLEHISFSSEVKPVNKEGYLEKKSPSLFKGWQKRYFTLRDGVITYYASVSYCNVIYSLFFRLFDYNL